MSEHGPHGDQLCPNCDCLDPSCADDQEGCYHSDCTNCKCCRRHAPDPVAPQVARVEQALREAETRHARELAEVKHSLQLYVRVWMNHCMYCSGDLLITQEEFREAAEDAARSRLSFEIEPDGETLRISEATAELVGVAGSPPSIPGPISQTKPSLFVSLSALCESEPLRSLEQLVANARVNLRRAPGDHELNHVKLSPEAYSAIIHDPAVLASPLYRLDPEMSSEIGLGRVLGVPVFIGPERSAP